MNALSCSTSKTKTKTCNKIVILYSVRNVTEVLLDRQCSLFSVLEPEWKDLLGKFVCQKMLVCGNSICCSTEESIFPEYVSNWVCNTHAHVTVRVAKPVLPFRLRNMSRKRKECLGSLKNVSSQDSVWNKDGERLDMLYLLVCIIGTPYSLASCLMWVFIICIIAISYSLSSRLIRFSSLHTCFPFTSPRFYT
jgi:hypothetical protein